MSELSNSHIKTLINVLENKIGTKKTLETLNNCLKEIIVKQFQTQNDIKNFIKFIKIEKKIPINNITKDINSLIQNVNNNKIKNYQNELENIYQKHLGNNSFLLRLEYTVKKIIQWLELYTNTNNSSVLQLKNKIIQYLQFIQNNEFQDTDIENIGNNLDDIFLEFLPFGFAHYQEKYNKNIYNKEINNIYKKWTMPNFIIYDKNKQTQSYSNTTSSNSNSNKCPNCNSIQYENQLGQIICLDCGTSRASYSQPVLPPTGRVGGNVIGRRRNDRITGIDATNQMVQGTRKDITLKTDLNTIENILESMGISQSSILNQTKRLWKDNVYKYLNKSGKRPGREKRNGLYIYTIWLVLQKNKINTTINDIQLYADKIDIIPDISESLYFFKQMMDNGFIRSYKQYIITTTKPIISTTILKKYLTDNNVPNKQINQIIKDIKNEINITKEEKFNKKIRENILYKTLKPQKRILKEYGINITRNLVKSFI
jgi:hypothetical protein